MTTDNLIQSLKETISELERMNEAAIRGYEMAMEELGHEGDYLHKDWSEPYQFLKSRLAQMRSRLLK